MPTELLTIPLPLTPQKSLEELQRTKMRGAFNMTKQRCYNPTCADYKYYGGRGITICESWLENFDNFYNDMGLKPEGLTLERKDNDGPYSKENCVWGTRKEQTKNRRMTKLLTVDGVTHTLTEWSEITGIAYLTLKARINVLKYEPKDVISKEVMCGGLLPGKIYKPRDYLNLAKGFDSPVTKLTPTQVVEVRERLATTTKSELARIYQVSRGTIKSVALKTGAYCD